jgi:hypothetical protein
MDPNDKSEPAENDLLAFVYDIPYFAPCGVFPRCTCSTSNCSAAAAPAG